MSEKIPPQSKHDKNEPRAIPLHSTPRRRLMLFVHLASSGIAVRYENYSKLLLSEPICCVSGHYEIRLSKPGLGRPDAPIWRRARFIPMKGEHISTAADPANTDLQRGGSFLESVHSEATRVIIACDCDREGQAIGQSIDGSN